MGKDKKKDSNEITNSKLRRLTRQRVKSRGRKKFESLEFRVRSEELLIVTRNSVIGKLNSLRVACPIFI